MLVTIVATELPVCVSEQLLIAQTKLCDVGHSEGMYGHLCILAQFSKRDNKRRDVNLQKSYPTLVFGARINA